MFHWKIDAILSSSGSGFWKMMPVRDYIPRCPLFQALKFSIDVVKDKLARLQATSDRSEGTGRVEPLGILLNAVNGSSVLFRVELDSRCSAGGRAKKSDARFNTHDLDATNVVYGFVPHEWNTEVLPDALQPIVSRTYTATSANSETSEPASSTDVDLTLAFDMFLQGKIVVDKAVSSTLSDVVPCGTNDADLKCRAMSSTLLQIGQYQANSTQRTPNNLVAVIGASLDSAIQGFDADSVRVTVSQFNVSSQIRLDLLEIHGSMPISDNPMMQQSNSSDNTTTRSVFAYTGTTSELCGSTNCVFVDKSNLVRLPHQIVVLPSQTNCSLTEAGLQYSRELHMYYPRTCVNDTNAFLAVGLTTFISGDEYGSNYTNFTGEGGGDRLRQSPYTVTPRRNVRLVIARFAWQSDDLAASFNATCDRKGNSQSCKGLSYELPRTGRYVFASEDALPTPQIHRASLTSPHRLVQLNQATVYVKEWNQVVFMERLSNSTFPKLAWAAEGLSGSNCSLLMESYLRHVDRNSYYLDASLMTVVRAGLFFLFSNSSVTELNNASVLVNATARQELRADGSLDHVRLKGDLQLRSVQVSVPLNSVIASIIGCGILLAIALVVIIVPTRRLEYFPTGTSRAAEYIVASNSDKYPNALHSKTLHFPATGESFAMEEFAIDELKLAHKTFSEDKIVL